MNGKIIEINEENVKVHLGNFVMRNRGWRDQARGAAMTDPHQARSSPSMAKELSRTSVIVSTASCLLFARAPRALAQ